MKDYVSGETIRSLREKQGYTQKQLADQLCVTDKAISKWETGRGLPDGTLLQPLAHALGVSLAELLRGEAIQNRNRSAQMKRMHFYVCPLCGNIISAVGEGCFSCCGITLPPLEAESCDDSHTICAEKSEDCWYVRVTHEMSRTHSLLFLAYVTDDRCEMVRLYPQQNAEARFTRRSSGILYAYCNRHGLFSCKI